MGAVVPVLQDLQQRLFLAVRLMGGEKNTLSARLVMSPEPLTSSEVILALLSLVDFRGCTTRWVWTPRRLEKVTSICVNFDCTRLKSRSVELSKSTDMMLSTRNTSAL